MTTPALSAPRRALRTALGNLAAEDRIALVFHSYLLLRVALAPGSPDRTAASSGSRCCRRWRPAVRLTRAELERVAGGCRRMLAWEPIRA